MWNEDFYLWLNEWMSIDKRLSFFFVCVSEQERGRERTETKAFLSVCVPSCPFSQDRGLERPHISGCCQAGVRGRDSKGQLFATRYPGSLTHSLWSNLASFASQVSPCVWMCVFVCVRVWACQRENTYKFVGVFGVLGAQVVANYGIEWIQGNSKPVLLLPFPLFVLAQDK